MNRLLLTAVSVFAFIASAHAFEFKSFTVNNVEFTMVKIPAGFFSMGATGYLEGNADPNEKPVHKVLVPTYYLGMYEVTQALWVAVMGSNPSHFTGDGNLPVESVTYDDCLAFITKLNEMTGECFRLPTEAEWEFAAKGRGLKDDEHLYGNGGDKLYPKGDFYKKQAKNRLIQSSIHLKTRKWASVDWPGTSRNGAPTGWDLILQQMQPHRKDL